MIIESIEIDASRGRQNADFTLQFSGKVVLSVITMKTLSMTTTMPAVVNTRFTSVCYSKLQGKYKTSQFYNLPELKPVNTGRQSCFHLCTTCNFHIPPVQNFSQNWLSTAETLWKRNWLPKPEFSPGYYNPSYISARFSTMLVVRRCCMGNSWSFSVTI